VVLLASELLTPGAFFQFFFGIGGIAVGLLGAFGLDLPLPAQLLAFLALSLGSLALLRRPLKLRFATSAEQPVDQLTGSVAIALDDIPVQGVGQAELRGSVWNVRNVGESVIAKSQRCRVEKVDGLTLDIRG
jgi:membrane protein implicated in regulation of membrane protease activity